MSLELDNENLRRKLQDLRKANSSLVTENHRLVEMLESAGCELTNSSSRIRNLEESTENYRCKTQELSDLLTAFKSVSKLSEKDCEKLRLKYEECSHQLAESAGLLQSQSAVIESLKKELEESKNLRAKTEADRNLALETAEKIQRCYEDLQSRFKKSLTSSEEETNALHKERTQLRDDLQGRCALGKSLQDDVGKLRAEINAQKNAQRESEQRNTDLRTQMKLQSTKIEKLEQDLENHKRFKVKHGEMKTVMDQQRKTISSFEAEIRGVHAKVTQLESLLLYSKKTSVKGKNPTPNDGTLASGVVQKTNKNGGKNCAFDGVDLEKLVGVESDILQLRADVLRLIGGYAEFSGVDLSGELNARQQDKGSVEGPQMENYLGQETAAALAGVEKRLSNFESMNARLVSHIAKLNAQISELQRNCGEQTTKQERELQKRAQQIALLEKQLDDKVQEVASCTSELNSVKVEMEQSRADRETVELDLDEMRRGCQEMALEMKRLRELHSEHCLELEGQITMVDKEREETKARLEQTESRCRALQQSLSQTMEASDALKDDLQSCRRLESTVHEMERREREATERAVELEAALGSLQTEMDVRAESAKIVEDDYRGRLEERNERLRLCEERLGRAEEQVGVSEGEITRLLTELNNSRAALRDGEERIEREWSLARSQVSELQQRLKRERSRLESSLDGAEERLEQALEELERKDRQIADLMERNEGIRVEKARSDELVSKLADSERLRVGMDAEQERLRGASVKQQVEIEMLRAMLKEREAAIADLQGRVVRAYKELQDKTRADKRSFAEVEALKAEAHTKDSRLAEAARKAELQEGELRSCRDQLESVQAPLTQCRDELQRNWLDSEALKERLQEREWDLQQKSAKVKQLEQALDERLSVLTESEQRRLRFEGAIQKNQLNAEQHEKQVAGLEDQLHDLLALVKEQCLRIKKDETTNGQLKAELDGQKSRVKELELADGNLKEELKRMSDANKSAEQVLCASRQHLQKMHDDLVGARHELASLRYQHDRLAKDLAEAVALLQQKDSELTKLLETLSVAEECRARYSGQLQRSEEAYDSLKAGHERDLHRLRTEHETEIAVWENESRSMRQELAASHEQQRELAKRVAQLVDELTRLETERRDKVQRAEERYGHAEKMNLQAEERASAITKTKPRMGVKTDAGAWESSRCTSESSILSSSDSEAAPVETRLAERNDHRRFPDNGSSYPGVDCPAGQRGSIPGEGLQNSGISSEHVYSSFSTQQCAEDNSLSNDFFQTMWTALLNSEVEERYGHHLTPGTKQDESRLTLCTPVPDSDHSESADDSSAPVIKRSAPVGNPSSLSVYHLAPSGIHFVSNSNSYQPPKDPGKASRSTAHPQCPTKSQTPDIPTEPFQRQPHTPNPKRNEPIVNTRLSRSATKPSNNAAPKRIARSAVVDSPFSPIFANRHSPNPTTAISYYEKVLPASKSDAEVEKIIAGRDFYDGERFSSLSDE